MVHIVKESFDVNVHHIVIMGTLDVLEYIRDSVLLITVRTKRVAARVANSISMSIDWNTVI